jgi:hypothetical protein
MDIDIENTKYKMSYRSTARTVGGEALSAMEVLQNKNANNSKRER